MIALQEAQARREIEIRETALAVRIGRFMNDRKFQEWFALANGRRKPKGLRQYPVVKKPPK